ncbi:uncharacterized protein M437DRAFT_77609 [Aureobasidium melanogenum CBS 110374]|uniref:Uncharacterized protein n=1 Tax=Aureobasidium melanogenum (strain CBS 110374) TaxID=1043003 RepID=A0A074WCF9_AURM1|nr:uncharacterized protein M437DRAFT_77609 [Aureobasidium melanogenum CBS 110374]KEQ60176.1 hypothetical protein M437DRAFT_77609 [Aureobasidium melanogenum CBS 110374]
MCISPSDSSSTLSQTKPYKPKYQMETQYCEKSTPASSKHGPDVDILNVRSSFNEKLMRIEAEPRDFVYVYDYIINCNADREGTGHQHIDQVTIPYSMRSVPIKTGTGGFGGGHTVVARVHVNMALRVQRWLGMQKQLYIVDAIKG